MYLAKRRFELALFFSLTIHILLLALAQHLPGHDWTKPRQSVTVIYQEASNRMAQATRRLDAKRNHRGKSNLGRKSQWFDLPLSAFVPKMNFSPSLQADPAGVTDRSDMSDTDSPQALNWDDSQAYDGFGLTGAEVLSSEQIDFIQSLWRTINRNIEENPFLSEYNHTGKVFLHFEVDESGRLVRGSLQASAIDRVLKVIAARALRIALRNETGDVHFARKRLWVNARFSWSAYQACESLRGSNANFLSFCHYAENKRKTFSSSEKAATLVSSVINHGPWAFEDMNEYNREENRRNSQFNPFEEYERDPDWNL